MGLGLRNHLRECLPERLWHTLYQLYPPNVLLRLDARRRRDVFCQIERYCMFVGYGRSGHSLVGQLLNAHREAVVAHEAHALLQLDLGLTVEQTYAWILTRDQQFEQRDRQWTNHNYRVPGLAQGEATRLRVIGDKKGGRTTDLLARRPELFDRLRDFDVPIHVIHHVRHPYDNISSMARRTEASLTEATREYFQRATHARAHLERFAEQPHASVIETHHEDLISNTQRFLQRLLRFLELEPYPGYLEGGGDVVFESPHRSRDKVTWPPHLTESVAERAADFAFLKRYDF